MIQIRSVQTKQKHKEREREISSQVLFLEKKILLV